MPAHPQHDAVVGPFHGNSLQDSARGRSRHCRVRGVLAQRNNGLTSTQPLNQPCPSPVKEKYRPAAVSAQDTISIALSSWRPFWPMSTTSE